MYFDASDHLSYSSDLFKQLKDELLHFVRHLLHFVSQYLCKRNSKLFYFSCFVGSFNKYAYSADLENMEITV